MEEATFDGSSHEHLPLLAGEVVEPGSEECLDRPRNDELAGTVLRCKRKHLLDEERVALGSLSDFPPYRYPDLALGE